MATNDQPRASQARATRAAADQPRARQRGFLSRELLVDEALALLDEDGPGALSMRRLADRLGVAPNALYTHVRDKADLVDGLIDQVYAGLDLDPDPSAGWAEQLAAISREVRAHLLARPAVVPLALQQPGLGPNGLRLGEAIYRVLRSAGFADQAVVGIVYALLTYILGFVALEVPRAGTDPQTSDEFVRRLHAFFAALPPGEFPHTVELAPLLARISTEDQFEFGVRTFLAGLARHDPAAGPRPSGGPGPGSGPAGTARPR